MIREFSEADLGSVLKIWLSASVEAHDFVESLFWHQRLNDMRDKYLLSSKTFVFERAGRVLGFYSLKKTNLAALFVDPQAQGDGIGMRLLTDAKQKSQALSLSVYKHNCRTIGFYHRCGFSIVDESLDPHTGHIQLTMSI